MKESTDNHKSHKHSKHSHSQREDQSNLPGKESDKYKNVLKERHYKDVPDLKKSEKHRRNDSKHDNHPKHDNHSTKGKDKTTERNNSHRKPEVFSSSGRSEKGKQKRPKQREETAEESYEELSRKKQRIESELLALDLEEAAAKKSSDKKVKRASDHSRKKEKPREKDKHVRIKESPDIKQEPVSDDERRTNPRNKPNLPSTNGSRSHPRQSQPSRSTNNDDGHWGNQQSESKKTEKPKEKPNFEVSGKLAEDTNMYNGVVIKYNEPSEARKPRRRWRLYPFKGDSDLPHIPIHRQSAYLFGRTRSIADIPIDHPSCSKQHAVLQFRLVAYKREDNTTGRRVRPYIIDLESSNGTFVNNKQIEARKYVELLERDVIKFGFSSREYVVLHEESKNEEEDDDVVNSD